MNLTFCHHSHLPVVKYGGTERFLFWLMKELASIGHEVNFLGLGGPELSNHGINFYPTGKDQENWHKLIPERTEILHLFSNYNCEKVNIPTILTVEGNGQYGEKFPRNTVFVSKKHAQIHGSDQFVHNGIDLAEYPLLKNDLDWNNFMFLAKASWSVKNLKDCVRTCKKLKKHLHIAGGKSWWPSRYTHSYGMIDNKKKLEIFQNCDALLFPVLWDEPFGIAIIEAMACGLPVIGSNFGSLKELIPNHVGRACSSYDEFFAYIETKPEEFSPEVIRQYVESNFSMKVISQKYLEKYEQVLSGKSLNKQEPTRQSKSSPTDLFQF